MSRPTGWRSILDDPAFADLAATIPVATRASPVTVAFASDTVADAIGWVNTLSIMSAFLR